MAIQYCNMTEENQTLLQTLLLTTSKNDYQEDECDQQQEEEEINFDFAYKPEEEQIVVEGLTCFDCGCVGQCYCLSQYCPPNCMAAHAQSLQRQGNLEQPAEEHHVYGGDSYLDTIYEDVEYNCKSSSVDDAEDEPERYDDSTSSCGESVSESNFALLLQGDDMGNLLADLYDSDGEEEEDLFFNE